MANLHHRTSVLLVCQRMPSASLFQVSTPSSKSSLGAQRKGHHAFARLLNWCSQSCRLLHTYQRLRTPHQANNSNAEVRIQNYCNRYNLWQPLHLDMPASALWSNFKHNFAVVPVPACLFFCEAAMQALFPLPGSTEVR